MKILLILLLLAGCTVRKETVFSPTLVESGKVVDTLHTQPHTSTDVNVGVDMDGKLYVHPTTTTIPETWGVVFRCAHGNKFCIQGTEARYKQLWERLDAGMDVSIKYREQYAITKTKQEDGTWKETERVLVDYDFLDAIPTPIAEVTSWP